MKLRDITMKPKKSPTKWAALSRENIQSWDEANANFFSGVQDAGYMIRLYPELRRADDRRFFGIYNILNMMVLQKRGEIAILRSM